MIVKGRDLRKYWDEKGPKATLRHLQESFEKGEITGEDFSIRDLATHLITDGRERVDDWSRQRGRGGFIVQEAADYVGFETFSTITGQLIFSTIKAALENDELIGNKLFTTLPSQFQKEEIVPGISRVTDEFEDEVPELHEYPLLGVSEEKLVLPRAEKRGGIIGLSKEAIIGDRTGDLLKRAQSAGEALAIRKERQQLDVFIGGVNPYVRNDVARNTYANVAGTSYFDNIVQNALVNYTDVQAAANLFFAIREPMTGTPLAHSPTTFVCSPTLMWTARPVFRDQTVRLVDRAAAAGQIGSEGVNRIPWDLELLNNEHLVDRLLIHGTAGNGGLACNTRDLSNAYWFIGRPRDCFFWKEIWPLTVQEAPANNEAEFMRDVALRFKVGYYGVPGVLEPRYMVRSDGTAA